MSALLTPGDLAATFAVDEETILEWRRVYRWPSVKVGRTIRFTPEHVDQIISAHSAKPVKAVAEDPPAAITGQTKRSARRSA